MADIGIVGSGIAGLQLGLALQQYGIPATIYSERTPEQQLARQLSNMVARNGITRERERRLGVNHWDLPAYDLGRLSATVMGQPRIAFSGRIPPPAHAVDMRIYWSRLLEDFSSRGGRVVIRTFQAEELAGLSERHDLVVVASGRASLSTIFPRVAEHSPFSSPQRLVVAGLFRGVAYSEPRALELVVSPRAGEILVLPVQSFEPDLTGIGIMIIAGGAFEPLRHLRYDDDPRAFVAVVLGLLREHAPTVYERVDPRTFDLSRPLDLAYAAITPTVRRGFVTLSNGKPAMALGDAHVVIDPLTGQGANNASHAALVLAEAIRGAGAFDRAFCERVEREICSYVVPVSDACNARVQPPPAHFREFIGAAGRYQAIADAYGEGYNHPARFWAMVSSPERTAAFLGEVAEQGNSTAAKTYS